MCLSTVYLGEKTDEFLVAADVADIACSQGAVVLKTLFGASKTMPGYMVGEVNLLEHYVILIPDGGSHDVT
jgi:predicted RNA-binding protein